jgi:hypothetical protein
LHAADAGSFVAIVTAPDVIAPDRGKIVRNQARPPHSDVDLSAKPIARKPTRAPGASHSPASGRLGSPS